MITGTGKDNLYDFVWHFMPSEYERIKKIKFKDGRVIDALFPLDEYEYRFVQAIRVLWPHKDPEPKAKS